MCHQQSAFTKLVASLPVSTWSDALSMALLYLAFSMVHKVMSSCAKWALLIHLFAVPAVTVMNSCPTKWRLSVREF
jgi:hypothetical protein